MLLSFALLWKMASGSELPEYSSPAKRRKIDGDRYEAPLGSELDFRSDKLLGEHAPEDLEGIFAKIWAFHLRKFRDFNMAA